MKHGRSAYVGRGCRCDICRDANKDYQARLRQRLRERVTGDESWHGTVGGYTNHGCRCEPCSRAQRDTVRARRQAAVELAA
jgi:hypothetical protein